MRPGVYVNCMSADEQDRVPEAYRERWDRMVTVKSRYASNNFFRLNQNVPTKTGREIRESIRSQIGSVPEMLCGF
jgi:hypothetical protein